MRANSSATRHRKLEQALRESEARRQAVLESALDCFICTDSQGRITDFNSAAERTFRITRVEAIGQDLAETIFPLTRRENHRRELFAKPDMAGIDVLGSRLETVAIRANGAEFPAEVTVSCFAIKGQANFNVTIRDVTARKRAEETLVRLAAIVESSQDAIVGFDFEGCITTWNRGAERMSGYSESEAIGKSMLFLMPDSRAFDYTRCVAELKARRSLENFETVWIAKDGKRVDVSLTTSSILNAYGEMVGGSIIAHDITVRKHAEEALRKSNETSIYGSPIPVIALDRLGNVTMWNGAAQKVFGWTEREVRGTPYPMIPAEDLEATVQLHSRVFAGETVTNIEVRRKTREGSALDMSLSLTPLWDEHGKVRGMLGFLNDITESKRTELALRRAEEKYRSIFENAVEGIYQAAPDGRYISANAALTRMMGMNSPEELLASGATAHSADFVDAERRIEFQRLMSQEGRVRGFQYELQRNDGTSLWVSENAHVVRDDRGKLVHYEGTVEDITRQRELEDQIRQMQKIEAIGRLAGGVAHDFNNILMAISSYAELLCRKLPEGDPGKRYVDEIVRSTDRGSYLTQSLLAFSRKQILAPQIVDLNALVRDQINMLERLLGESIVLNFVPGPDLGHIKVDPGQIQQVVMNLVINARDAMADGGEVLIETANAELDPSGANSSVTSSCDYVMISVSDTGCGIDDDIKEHIFEPFFTTKEQGKGTGLGLATVFGIVKQSNGQIFLQTEPQQGTTFKVYFPRVDSVPVEVGADRHAIPQSGHETILLVEDQPAIRESAAEYLSDNGYTVLQAQNGPEALDIAAKHTGPIDLLLTDVVMPQMSGKELAERLAGIHPRASVVFMSGYSSNVLSNNLGDDQKYLLLRKPFRLARLGQTVRDVLDDNMLERVAGD
jgi:two-component system, cell cycle sensor histidine kinase and response regulator CckA